MSTSDTDAGQGQQAAEPLALRSNAGLGVSPLRPRYRIVRDGHAGFEVQVWRWWLPLWLQAGFCNTHFSEERAAAYANRHANPVVRDLGHL